MKQICIIHFIDHEMPIRVNHVGQRLELPPTPPFTIDKVSNFSLHYVSSGELSVKIDNNHYKVSAGDLIICFPKTIYSIEVTQKSSIFHCHFELKGSHHKIINSKIHEWALLAKHITEKTTHHANSVYIPDHIHLTQRDEVAKTFARIIQEQAFGGVASQLAYQADFFLLLHLISKEALRHLLKTPESIINSGKAYQHVFRAIQLIETKLLYAPNVSNLAKELRIDSDYLGRLFKKQTGQSIGSYILSRKLREAKDLLLSTNLNIKEVASKTGFNDPLYFSRIFRRKNGMSPSEFIRENSGLQY